MFGSHILFMPMHMKFLLQFINISHLTAIFVLNVIMLWSHKIMEICYYNIKHDITIM